MLLGLSFVRSFAMPNDPIVNATRTRVAAYVRVSTTDQTAENQLRALREHAERAGWVIVAEFADHAVSGTREKRPGLDALLAEARRRKFDLIAVAALDRLGRNLRHLVTLLDELQHLGVGLRLTAGGARSHVADRKSDVRPRRCARRSGTRLDRRTDACGTP